MPEFLISIGAPVYEETKLKYKEEIYLHPEPEKFINLSSLHMKGSKDPYFPRLSNERFYIKDPLVVNYDDGHKFPRFLEESEFSKLREFVKKQYEEILKVDFPPPPPYIIASL